MLHLFLVDAELERVPDAMRGHPQVAESARRWGTSPSKMLLDSSLHYAALRKVPDGERRGRPDLVHMFLLTVLESIPNKRGQVRVTIHTRNDDVVRIEPDTRLVRNYPRFCGLLQQLFERGTVGEPRPLLTLERDTTLATLLAQERPDRTLVMDPAGVQRPPAQLFDGGDPDRNVAVLIGGFPSGDYRSPLPADAARVSIAPEPLTVWTVAAEILAHYPHRPASGSPDSGRPSPSPTRA
jgi:rRNA small subunit pseudouridine methyltransferase Nep1